MSIAATKRAQRPNGSVSQLLSKSAVRKIFPKHLELVPQLNEVYELELAFLESQALDDDEIVRNGAYFARVGDTLTRHFLMCSGEPVRLPKHSSSRLRSFFSTNQFKTGYATHGLFPYRGKFHPQMVKGILNAIGLKPGSLVLDPMMGSGTVLIEARLMGIRSIGIDASPFCRFMANAKLDALTLDLTPLRAATENPEAVFEYFRKMAGHSEVADQDHHPSGRLFSLAIPIAEKTGEHLLSLPDGCEAGDAYNFLLLAYLDSAGYSQRSQRKSPYDQFCSILERYIFVAEKIQCVLDGAEEDLAEATALEGDARQLPVGDASIDGILFSPPYSFAIDYLENDAYHLGFMGVDVDDLRGRMVGLRGKNPRLKFDAYRADMEQVLSECSRVLRPGCICSVVVGTNTNQIGSILGVGPAEVQGIDDLLVDMGSAHGLRLVRKISRQITGMANTMRTEFIVMLQRI